MEDTEASAASLSAPKQELIRVPKAEFISDVGAFLEGMAAPCTHTIPTFAMYFRSQAHTGCMAARTASLASIHPVLGCRSHSR